MYDTILVPTDGSEAAMKAVDHAVDLAAKYGATLHTLAVVDPTGFNTLDVDPSSVVVAMEREARRAAAAVESIAEEAALPIETAVVRGDPARTITTYATDSDVDLIVMGTHGRSGLNRYLLGSVTERVVRTADVPVLTVRYEE